MLSMSLQISSTSFPRRLFIFPCTQRAKPANSSENPVITKYTGMTQGSGFSVALERGMMEKAAATATPKKVAAQLDAFSTGFFSL